MDCDLRADVHEWHIPFRNRHTKTEDIALSKPDHGLA
jgi:hypothetical protein